MNYFSIVSVVNMGVQVVDFKVILRKKVPYFSITSTIIPHCLIGTNMQRERDIIEILSEIVTLDRFVEHISAEVVIICSVPSVILPVIILIFNTIM